MAGSNEIRVMGGPPVPAMVAIEMRRPEFRKHMRDVTAQDPELQRLLRERREAERRYDAARTDSRN